MITTYFKYLNLRIARCTDSNLKWPCLTQRIQFQETGPKAFTFTEPLTKMTKCENGTINYSKADAETNLCRDSYRHRTHSCTDKDRSQWYSGKQQFQDSCVSPPSTHQHLQTNYILSVISVCT